MTATSVKLRNLTPGGRANQFVHARQRFCFFNF